MRCWGEEADDVGWTTDRRSVQFAESLYSGPDCVAITAVLATGKKVALPRTCGRVGGGGSCTVAATARATPLGYLLVALFFMCGRKRHVG